MSEQLSAAGVLDACDLAIEVIEVPEWGGTVRVKQQSAEDILLLHDELQKAANNLDGICFVLVRTMVDAAGERLFTPEDIPKLKQKNFKLLRRIHTAALKINTMGDEAVPKKDSSEADTDASRIDSPKS